MAKLKSYKFRCELPNGDIKRADSLINVNADGDFMLRVPTEVSKHISTFPLPQNIYCVPPTSRSKYYYLRSKNLRDLEIFGRTFWKEVWAPKYQDKLVICYDFVATCSFCLDDDGNIHQHGLQVPEGSKYHWQEKYNRAVFGDYSRDSKDFTVGLKAEVRVRRDFTYYDGSTSFKYKRPTDYVDGMHSDELGEVLGIGPWGETLNEFQGVLLEENLMTELAYSEKVAKGFYEAMLSLCNTHLKLVSLMQDPDLVVKRLESNAGLLEAPKEG